MDEKRTAGGRPHGLILRGRNSLGITGVKDVLSYDESEVLLETEMGLLQIRGKEMKVKRVAVEAGEVDLNGQIDSLIYTDASGRRGKKQESVWKRMLK